MKKLIFLLTLVIAVLFSAPAFAADRYHDIINEVNTYVDQGKLPQFHKQLAKKEGYQVFYTKKVRTNKEYDGLASLAQTSETTLRSIIQTYENRTNNVWYDVLTNLAVSVPVFGYVKLMLSASIYVSDCTFLTVEASYIPNSIVFLEMSCASFTVLTTLAVMSS